MHASLKPQESFFRWLFRPSGPLGTPLLHTCKTCTSIRHKPSLKTEDWDSWGTIGVYHKKRRSMERPEEECGSM